MIERLSKIHEMIKSGNFPNSNDFANETESSAATISRDIEYMRDRMNAPIKYDYVQKGFFYTKKLRAELSKLSFRKRFEHSDCRKKSAFTL